ncbi:MAG: prenyltransferase/squalene oxidase repeat-containing protein [Planctomycetota bacterium]
MLARLSILPILLLAALPAQSKGATKAPRPRGGSTITEFPIEGVAPIEVEAASAKALKALVGLEEEGGQWPYEGVYREDRGNLPVGYRVGGTSLTILGMLSVPGLDEDSWRQQAVERALRFVLETLDHERMQIGFKGGYDVRGWGQIYALTCLLHLRDAKRVPAELAETVAKKTEWLVKALVESAIPESGGWNYSRRRGYKNPRNGASTFMTAPALQALFHAKDRGYDVPDEVIEQALAALERSRSKQGGYAYQVPGKNRNDADDSDLHFMDKTPGGAARVAACETTLMLAGRGDAGRLEKALALFFDHWEDLAVRKSQRGTHIEPYGIAPYYFMFGHLYCAQAIEMIDDGDKRKASRSRMLQVLAWSREGNGSWNDRQFPRSAGYGTAMALMAMHMPRLPELHEWRAGAKEETPAESKGGK